MSGAESGAGRAQGELDVVSSGFRDALFFDPRPPVIQASEVSISFARSWFVSTRAGTYERCRCYDSRPLHAAIVPQGEGELLGARRSGGGDAAAVSHSTIRSLRFAWPALGHAEARCRSLCPRSGRGRSRRRP